MKLSLLLMGEGGGGVESITPFLFVKTIEKLIRLFTSLIFFLSGSFEDMVIIHVFIYPPVMERYNPHPHQN